MSMTRSIAKEFLSTMQELVDREFAVADAYFTLKATPTYLDELKSERVIAINKALNSLFPSSIPNVDTKDTKQLNSRNKSQAAIVHNYFVYAKKEIENLMAMSNNAEISDDTLKESLLNFQQSLEFNKNYFLKSDSLQEYLELLSPLQLEESKDSKFLREIRTQIFDSISGHGWVRSDADSKIVLSGKYKFSPPYHSIGIGLIDMIDKLKKTELTTQKYQGLRNELHEEIKNLNISIKAEREMTHQAYQSGATRLKKVAGQALHTIDNKLKTLEPKKARRKAKVAAKTNVFFQKIVSLKNANTVGTLFSPRKAKEQVIAAAKQILKSIRRIN